MLGRILGYLFLLLNFIAALWLGCCFASSFTPPATIKYLQLFSLSTPLAIVVNVLFAVIWLLSVRKLRSLLSLLALGVCYKLIITVFAFNFFGNNDMAGGDEKLKVMLWNVHGFGIFDGDEKTRSAKIFSLIHKEDPDILCMPEYYVMDTPDSSKPYTRRIMDEQGLKYSHFICDNTLGTKVLLGTAVFSKYPVIDYKVYQLSRYIFMTRCDIQLPTKRIISFYATHLYSFMLSDDDLDYIQTASNNQVVKGNYKYELQRYMHKFNRDYKERAREADSAAHVLARSPYPVVLCGDFNDLPASYTYTVMRGSMNDAFIDKGMGIGRTYNHISPTLRIDHVLYEHTALKAIGCKIQKTTLSDHNPVVVNFKMLK